MKKYFYLILLLTGLCFGQQQTGGVNIPTGFHLQDNQHLDDRENTVATVADLQNIHNKVDGLTCKVTATPGKLYLYDEPTNTWSIVGGTDINHTGLFVNYTAPFDVTVGAIHTFVNQNNRIPSGSFTVTETTKPVYIIVTENLANGSSKKYTYAFIGGTGTWGNSSGFSPTGTATTAPMFTLIGAPNSLTNTDISNDPNTQTISLGNLPTGDYVAAANSVIRDLSNDNLVYYFSYTQDSVLYLVQFIGTNGIYGGSGTQLVSGDFAASTNSGVTPAQNLESVLGNGNHTGNDNDIIFDNERAAIFKGGNSGDEAIFSFNDELNLTITDPTFKVNNKYSPLTVLGVEADVNGNIDPIEALSDQFIPLTGTTEGNPVTGDIEFINDGDAHGLVLKVNDEDNNKSYVSVDSTGAFLYGENNNGSSTINVSASEIVVASTYPQSRGIKSPVEFNNDSADRTQFTQTGFVLDKITGHTDIPDDFYIACTYQSDPTIRGRYLTYKTDTYRTFDLSPYIPDFVDGKIFSTNGIEIVDKNTIILSGQLTGTTGNLFILTLKGGYINDNVFTIDSSEFKELPDILRDNNNEPSKIQLAGYTRGFYYFVCRATQQTPSVPTQIIKINPFNLSQIKTTSLPTTSDFIGSVQNAQVHDGNIYFLSTSNTVAAKFLRIGENLDDPEVLFTANNPGANERVFRNFPFVVYNGKVFVPTIQNTTAGTSKIGLSSYDLAKKTFLNSVPTQTINSNIVGSPNYPYPHWMTCFGGKIYIHTAANNANQSRSLIRFDPNTLLVEASTPVPFRITDDNTITNDGFIYLNPEAETTASLLKIKADFANNETFTYVNEGAATTGYYSLGSPSNLVYAENFKTKLSEFNDDYPLKTINGQSIKGTGDIIISGGGGGGATNYPKILVLDTAPATYTGTSTQTILKVHTIPANTLSAGVLSVKFIFSNTGVAGTKAVMCYIGNTNTLPSTQYGRITPSATGRFHEITRDLIINASGVITASNAAASAPTDEAINGSAKTTISGLNFTQPIYIFSTVTLANPADDMTQESAEIIFKPQQ